MPASADESRRLRDLHEEYVWRVNAAGRGRPRPEPLPARLWRFLLGGPPG